MSEEKCDIIFQSRVTGAYSGQVNAQLIAFDGCTELYMGHIDYAEFEEKAHISFINVKEDLQGQSIGCKLIEELSKEYPYEEIEWGWMTEEGYKLKQKCEKLFKERKKDE